MSDATLQPARQTMSLPPHMEFFEHRFLFPHVEPGDDPTDESRRPATLIQTSCVTRRPATRCSCAFYNLDWAEPFEEGTALP